MAVGNLGRFRTHISDNQVFHIVFRSELLKAFHTRKSSILDVAQVGEKYNGTIRSCDHSIKRCLALF